MKPNQRISESEWKIMEVIWEDPPVTANQVFAALGEREKWKAQTIKTLISRLVQKGALSFEARGNKYYYLPEITRDEAVAAETESFLDRISRGSLAPMLAQLVNSNRPLQADEIEALRRVLREGKEDK